METPKRGYAVGIQEFDWIRERNAVYVDKTALVYKMVNTNAKYFFLSRPRRFGKSLLVDTLKCYFEGRKDLFEGLAMATLEKEWKKYPVIRIDLSVGKYYRLEVLTATISGILRRLERKWGLPNRDDLNFNERMTEMIQFIHKKTGMPVVVLVDEYDAPMLDSINKPELQDQIREHIRNLFSPLKGEAEHLRFVFLTGISKFSQLSVFSELNNLQNLTFDPQYEALCGITEEELLTQLKPDIEQLAMHLDEMAMRFGMPHVDYDETVRRLKSTYDGYHFSKKFTDIYNPWSLINAFNMGDIQNFWFSTGTPTSLVNILRVRDIDMPELEGIHCRLDRFDAPTERITDPIPALFQSGYLTLKAYDGPEDEYILGFPNEEVYRGFANSLYQYYCEEYVGSRDNIARVYREFRDGTITIQQFMQHLRQFFSAMPYDVSNKNERHYQSVLYALLVAVGADVSAEVRTAISRMDIALRMPKAIYILELKYDGSSEDAVEQVNNRDYAASFAFDKRPVWAVGVNFSSTTRTIESWEIREMKKG